MPSIQRKPQQFLCKFSAGFALAILLIPAARAGDEDQQAYCKYVTQQAAAQRDLLRTPDAVAGFTQPNTGLPTQVVWGLTGSLSNVRKASLTMDAARKDCELYSASASAQQAIQYAIPSLEKQALQNRLTLIQQASENLDGLLSTTTKMVDAQNMTRPMAFALQTTKIKLEADRADTQSKIVAIYAPQLSDKPLKDLVAEKQAREVNERSAIYKLNRQNDWDVALSVGAHQQVNPLIGNPGAYGEVTVSYNLASHAINKHLDQAATSYDDWKKVQEGDVIRNAEVLKQQLADSISVQDNRLKALQEQQKQIESNLQILGHAETSAALDFGNQLSTAKLLLQIEIGDATFRLNQLKEFLAKNF
jgi:chaperonin cofactor prefoldin